jgi:putative restriction endonuclease
MPKLTLTAAFAHYNAELKNVRWASSAIAKDGSLVVSCWHHFLESVEGGFRYEDHLSRWPIGHAGRNLLAVHLKQALTSDLPVRLVLATLDEPKKWVSGAASPLPKTFSTHDNVLGRVVEFDGNAFTIKFGGL